MDDLGFTALNTNAVQFSKELKARILKEGIVLRETHMELCRIGAELAVCQDGLPGDDMNDKIDEILRLPIDTVGDVYAHMNGAEMFIRMLPQQIAVIGDDAEIERLGPRYFRAVKTFFQTIHALKHLADADIDRQLQKAMNR